MHERERKWGIACVRLAHQLLWASLVCERRQLNFSRVWTLLENCQIRLCKPGRYDHGHNTVMVPLASLPKLNLLIKPLSLSYIMIICKDKEMSWLQSSFGLESVVCLYLSLIFQMAKAFIVELNGCALYLNGM